MALQTAETLDVCSMRRRHGFAFQVSGFALQVSGFKLSEPETFNVKRETLNLGRETLHLNPMRGLGWDDHSKWVKLQLSFFAARCNGPSRVHSLIWWRMADARRCTSTHPNPWPNK